MKPGPGLSGLAPGRRWSIVFYLVPACLHRYQSRSPASQSRRTHTFVKSLSRPAVSPFSAPSPATSAIATHTANFAGPFSRYGRRRRVQADVTFPGVSPAFPSGAASARPVAVIPVDPEYGSDAPASGRRPGPEGAGAAPGTPCWKSAVFYLKAEAARDCRAGLWLAADAAAH